MIKVKQITLDEWLGLERKTVPEKFKRWQLWEAALPLINQYTQIKIPKRKGGDRIISIPPKELKKIQKGILRFLKELWRTWHLQIQGLYRGSYIEHARIHSKSRFVFQFDIKDAFPSVNIALLKKILYNRIRWESIDGWKLVANEYEADQLADLIIALTTFKETLPQGAPTSPFLFYIYILETNLIGQLYRCCLYSCCPSGLEMEISCYIDGIVVSSQKPLPPDVRERMVKTVEKTGFKVNEKKIWHRDCRHGNPMITGISIDGNGKISLPKKKIRKWRGIIHRAGKFDPDNLELRQKIEGFIASLKPIYGDKLPPQIEKSYLLLKQNKPA